MPQNYGITLMQVIGDKNQISEDIFEFMISYLSFPQKSVCSELAKRFSISILNGRVLAIIIYQLFPKQAIVCTCL